MTAVKIETGTAYFHGDITTAQAFLAALGESEVKVTSTVGTVTTGADIALLLLQRHTAGGAQ